MLCDIVYVVSGGFELFGALIIALGGMFAAFRLAKRYALGDLQGFNFNLIRLALGRAILLGLEFMVAGDVIHTMHKPDYHEIGILLFLVVIRTTLAFFLNREINELSEEQQGLWK